MLKVEHITEEEKSKIRELKSVIDHELTPDLVEDKSLYYRFLKARDFNLKHAEALLRKHLSDRKTYLGENFKDYYPPEYIKEYLPLSFVCFDKEGSVVLYLDLGRTDPRGLLSLFTFKQLVQFVAFNLEENFRLMTKESIRRGKSVTKFCIILDMDKLNLFNATFKKGIETLINGFQLYQDNYPERMKSVYIINASFYFYLGYPLIKAILASVLLQKIHIFGKDGWKEVLQENIDGEVLPAFLGGNRSDPDGNPWCTSFLVFGKKVPEELYSKKKKSIVSEKGVKKLTINRFSSSEIMLHIYEENTCIEWEFETKVKDIGFGLYYKDSSKENSRIEELIPKQRIDTMLSSEAGVYSCNRIGTYIIVFDNSYSWIYSKELYYRIRLKKPKMIN
ncbi:SEC14-like protein 3 [Parasteatoda tepidariorum]|uniref:SEC14-like protein 3 n=1 Tax=Parasteatoda tepidariorum TaxID=114398 RepID=UPI00077FDA09|nr:SEC14-like protein 3 [Parasteatoda tepidariorum]XP_015921590.1 SEC14-like protein 3 [Parasteatoda tepidariorum]XP_021001208.1 SEC14-like protein 3 [Parasteatoda tepidariorum]